MLPEKDIIEIIRKHIREGSVIAVGADEQGERLLREAKNMGVAGIEVVPSSNRIAQLCSATKIPITNLNETEIDTAIEFADRADADYNFVKSSSMSLVRDKMIAQSAGELIIIAPKKGFVKKVHGTIPFEAVPFGWKRSMMQLQNLGNARIRQRHGEPAKTETGNYIIDVDVAEIYSLEDIEIQAKQIPGVIETGLFIGYADRMILHNHGEMAVKTRIGWGKQAGQTPGTPL